MDCKCYNSLKELRVKKDLLSHCNRHEKAREGSWIIIQPLLIREEQVTHHGNGGISYQSIKISDLYTFYQSRYCFSILKRPQYPAFSIDAHNLFICQSAICWKNCQPASLTYGLVQKQFFTFCPALIFTITLAFIQAFPARFLTFR